MKIFVRFCTLLLFLSACFFSSRICSLQNLRGAPAPVSKDAETDSRVKEAPHQPEPQTNGSSLEQKVPAPEAPKQEEEEEEGPPPPYNETQAICYAERYPDLWKGFCHSDRNLCKTKTLYQHYINHPGKRVWGCEPPPPPPPMEGVPSTGGFSTFDWKDVNLTIKGVCGWHKCFFPSVHNQTIGYLVASDTEFDKMKFADNVAHDLHDRFGSKHFYLSVDRDIVSQDFKDHINSLFVRPGLGNEKFHHILTHNDGVAMQKVLVAPEPALFFGIFDENYLRSIAELDEFAPKIPDKEAFAKQLGKEHERLSKVLDYNQAVAKDLQALIDIHGNFYLIDLDANTPDKWSLSWDLPSETNRAKVGLMQVLTNLTVGGQVSF